METRNLKLADSRRMPLASIKAILPTITIFEKIEFSNISKDAIRTKLHYLRNIQVPHRTVLLDMKDIDVVFYWFKNWLHCDLKHWVSESPRDKRGCSQRVIHDDHERDTMRFYENGQHNFDYTLEDIEAYIK